MFCARLTNFSVILAGTFLLASCGNSDADAPKKIRSDVPAATAIVQPASQNEIITAAGTVRLRRETALGFTTSGKVASVRFDEGDRVKGGALIAALDTRTVSADLETARAERDRAEAEYNRIQSLYSEGWVTRARLEQSEAALRAARARVDASGFASSTAQIIAPSGGIILARNIDVGQIVSAGTTALILGETSKGFVLRVPLSDADASRLSIGKRALVKISAISAEPIEASVIEKDGRADERTGTFNIDFLLPSNDRLRSGQLGIIEIELPRIADGAIAIPATAIFGVRAGEGLVYVMDDKRRVKQRGVVIGRMTDAGLEISTGLVAGEIVVIRGIEKLREGDRISPVRSPQ